MMYPRLASSVQFSQDYLFSAFSTFHTSPVHRGSKVKVEYIRCFFAYSCKGPIVPHSHAILCLWSLSKLLKGCTPNPFHLNNNLQTHF